MCAYKAAPEFQTSTLALYYDTWMENVYVLMMRKKLLRSFSLITHIRKIKLDVGLLLSWTNGMLIRPSRLVFFLCEVDTAYNLNKVDHHPTFRRSRCVFVVRADGGWIDFSYQKYLRAYIREKYLSHAERFIREHFKRT